VSDPTPNCCRRGAVQGQQISFLFESLTSARTRERNFDRLPIPYRAVAADIETGQPVVLAEGSLSLAMRSSMSVPGVFDPVEWGDHLLVDGGIANNLPVNVVRDLGADVIIAVEVGTPPASRKELNNMAAFVGQLSNLMIANNTHLQMASLGEGDLLLQPELGSEITSAGFDKVAEAVVIGYAAAYQASDELAQFSVSADEYARYRATIESCVQGPVTIDFVEVENRSRFSDEVIEKRLGIDAGAHLDNDQLKAAVDRVYALGFLNLVRHEVVEADGATGVHLTVDQDARGANFLEWGLDLWSDGDDAELNLRVGYLKTDLDEYGSELRLLGQVGDTPSLMAELYKALGPELKWFAQPRAWAEWRDLTIYDDAGRPEAVLNIDQWGTNLGLQREFGNRYSLWGALRLYDGSVAVDVGEVPRPVGSFKGGEYAVGFEYDTIDNRYYPSSGALLSAQYYTADDSLGSDQLYDQSVNLALAAKTWGRHTLIGNLRYSTTLSGDRAVLVAVPRRWAVPAVGVAARPDQWRSLWLRDGQLALCGRAGRRLLPGPRRHVARVRKRHRRARRHHRRGHRCRQHLFRVPVATGTAVLGRGIRRRWRARLLPAPRQHLRTDAGDPLITRFT
jgi:NTE family protein